MTIVNKGKLLKTTGWIAVGIGLYLITVGHAIDSGEDVSYFNPTPPEDDNIIEAEWFEVTD